MTTSALQSGQTFRHANGTGNTLLSGAVIEFGTDAAGFAGVLVVSTDDGETGAVDYNGTHELVKTTGASTGGSQGDFVYWDGSGCTAVAGTDHLMGYFAEDAGDNDATCKVKLGG